VQQEFYYKPLKKLRARLVKHATRFAVLIAALGFTAPVYASGSNYGSGAYGAGVYNGSSTTSSPKAKSTTSGSSGTTSSGSSSSSSSGSSTSTTKKTTTGSSSTSPKTTGTTTTPTPSGASSGSSAAKPATIATTIGGNHSFIWLISGIAILLLAIGLFLWILFRKRRKHNDQQTPWNNPPTATPQQ
jgi:cobalamin biosynthesis Mg chelatase CobN